MRNATYCMSLGVVLMFSQGMQESVIETVLPGMPPCGRPVGAGLGVYPIAPLEVATEGSGPAYAEPSCVEVVKPSAPAPVRVPPPIRDRGLVWRMKRIFLEEGIPGELVWIAEVESAMNPRARSRSGALGLFQLMPATARRFGMRTGVSDERLSPEKSARAAARYLKQLHHEFGSWPLAIAAYNAGEGCVQNALRSVGVTSFGRVSGHLPLQTQSYVPRVMALVTDREGIPAHKLPAPSRQG